MKSCVLFVVFAACFILKSNAQTFVSVQVIDQFSKEGISNAQISIKLNNKISSTYFTSSKGEILLMVPTTDSVTFIIEHPLYELANPNSALFFNGTMKDTLRLKFKMNLVKYNEIAEVIIKPFGKPDTVFQSKRLSVLDFEFLNDGNLLLLTYSKNMRKETELLVYDGQQIVNQLALPAKGKELIRDFKGHPHVITENNVFGIFSTPNNIAIQQLDKSYFMTYLAPIVDTTVSKYYFSNFNPNYPAFDYYSFDQWDEIYEKIVKIEDKLMMELYRSEYKWADIRTKLWAKEKENETGVDAEIWVGATYFTQSIYYKQLYAPLFVVNDTVLVFDHYKNWLFRYSRNGDLLDSLPIYHHLQAKQTGWKKQILQDKETGQLYLLFDNAGWISIKRFDYRTGKLAEKIPLTFRYADKVLVRNNQVYYTYRPFETAQKKFLYKERFQGVK